MKKDLEELTRLVDSGDNRAFILHPGELVLGSTFERVAVANGVVSSGPAGPDPESLLGELRD